jgi:hypothetical protein
MIDQARQISTTRANLISAQVIKNQVPYFSNVDLEEHMQKIQNNIKMLYE